MLIGPLAGSLASLMPLWFVLGLGYSLTQTPTGRLLRRSAHPEDRPALFAAQFALSHACWLGTYPLAGWLGAAAGLDATFLVMAALSVAAVVAASRLWPVRRSGSHPARTLRTSERATRTSRRFLWIRKATMPMPS